jgi:cysteine synthase A
MDRRVGSSAISTVVVAAAAGAVIGAATLYGLQYLGYFVKRTGNGPCLDGKVVEGVQGLVGNTPLVRLHALSAATGCTVLGKAEYMNPGGSSKDRIALQMIRDAEAEGRLKPGGWLVEGTSGSTGISLAILAQALGYRAYIVMPDDQANEKVTMLRQFGATVELVKPVSIVNENHYVNVARKAAERLSGAPSDASTDDKMVASAVFCDQFETQSNFRAHYTGTGPEIWQQCEGKIDGFISGAGTGGTLAGVALSLKEKNPLIGTYLVDPPGSSLYAKVVHGVAYTSQQAERKLKRHRYDTIIEGVGIDRITANFTRGLPYIDGAFRCTDQEAVEMSRYLLRNEGLFVGSSTSMNCVGVVKLARKLGPGHTIVTVLCDSGMRHLSRFWNADYIEAQGLLAKSGGTSLDFVG